MEIKKKHVFIDGKYLKEIIEEKKKEMLS